MKQTIKRMTVLLLVFSLVFSMIPAVSAADTQSNTATLVTDVTALNAGDQIIIVAAASDYALSTTQNTNNRGQAAITKSDDGKTVTYSSDTQVITLAAGTVDNTFAFVVGVEKYLNATSSSSNYLKTGSALSDNGSWAITIDENGIANVVSSGTYTRNTIRYNSSSKLFACYAATNTQKDISIYKVDAAGVAPDDCEHSWSNGTCSSCGDVCGHDYVDDVCSICGMAKPVDYYLIGYINGANYGCEEDYENLGEYKFVDGQVTATFTETSYVFIKTGDNSGWYMTDGWQGEVTSATLYNTNTLADTANKLMVPGGVEVTFTLVNNGDDTFTLSYAAASEPEVTEPEVTEPEVTEPEVTEPEVTEPETTEPETEPVETEPVETEPVVTETLNKVVSAEQLKDATKVVLVAQVDGAYKALGTTIASKISPVTVNVADGTVTADAATIWSIEATDAGFALSAGGSYLAYNSSTNFKVAADAYEWGFAAGENGGFRIDSTATTRGVYYQISGDRFGAYSTSNASNSDYVSELLVFADVEATVIEPTEPVETDPIETEPTVVDYYLFGFINGANYGCEEDAANLGEYKFVEGKLVATFTDTSYVAVKTGDNTGWYMTDGWQGEVTSVTLYNTSVLGTDADKLMVPGGVEVTFTLVNNGDDTFTLSYTAASEPDTTEPETEPVETDPIETEPETEPTEPPVTEMTLNKVVSAEQLKDATKVVLVAQVDGAYKALGTTIASKISPVSVNVVDGTVTADAATIWSIEATDAGFALSAGGSYLAYNSSTNFKAAADAYEWGFAAGENGGFRIDSTATTRGVYYQISGDRFGAYATSNAANADYVSELLVFADVEATVIEPTEPVETDPIETEPTVVDYYLFGYINGANYGCEEDAANLGEYKFVDGKLVATFTDTSYVAVKTGDNTGWYMTDGWQGEVTSVTLYNTSVLGTDADKLMVPGGVEVTFTLVNNGDDTFALSYEAEIIETEPSEPTECSHSYDDGVVTTAPTCLGEGVKTFTCSLCGSTKTETVPAAGHDYTVTVVPPTCENNGYTVHACKNCSYSYNDTPVTPIGHNYSSVVTPPTCTEKGYTTYTCANCGNVYTWNETPAAGHSFVNGFCTVCGAADPDYVEPSEPVETEPTVVDYYLFGYINGANYGCEEDYENLGEYKFVDGKLVATFADTSYVAVKTGDNTGWYMTDGWQGEVTSVTLYNTSVLGTTADKLMVPGGVEVTFTLVNNGDDTFTLSYEAAIIETEPTEPVVVPSITLSYPTLSFESEVFYNVYFTVADAEVAVEDLGLLTWYTRPANTAAATYESAEVIIPGAVYNSASDIYMVRSEGVPAKKLGDNMYIRVYAKLADGTYAYSPVTYYNAKMYAADILKNSQSAEMKALVVAMLNYGAAAQVHFDHNADSLMNADLTADQKALVKAYSSDMIGAVITADTNKVGTFKSNGGFSNGYPSVSFEGAFAINYYLIPKQAVEGDMTLYCWDLKTYSSVDVLTEENATAKITMTDGGSVYFGAYTGIAAKQIDETVFVAGVYTSGGTRYSSPVISYSLGAYCAEQIANGSETMQEFAKATAVYGNAAKTYFETIG